MKPIRPPWLVLVVSAVLLACGQATPEPSVRQVRPATPAADAPVKRTAPLVIFLGDSLTAGYGLTPDRAFPALVGEALAREGRPIRVVNAGVSGDTSAGGLRRIPWILSQKPDVVVLELGANDGLRGQDADLEKNLAGIIKAARATGARVLLLGMKLPPNYGAAYTRDFARIYPEVAQRFGVPLVPFLLEGVAGRPELNLADGLHPNAEGQKIVAENVLPKLRQLVR